MDPKEVMAYIQTLRAGVWPDDPRERWALLLDLMEAMVLTQITGTHAHIRYYDGWFIQDGSYGNVAGEGGVFNTPWEAVQKWRKDMKQRTGL